MSINNKKLTCPCCKSSNMVPLISFKLTEEYCQTISSLPKSFDQTYLKFNYCNYCDFVKNTDSTFIPHYDFIDRGTSSQLPLYLKDLFNLIKINQYSAEDLILEIGCNDGTFLQLFTNLGFSNLVGFEPSKFLNPIALSILDSQGNTDS